MTPAAQAGDGGHLTGHLTERGAQEGGGHDPPAEQICKGERR